VKDWRFDTGRGH